MIRKYTIEYNYGWEMEMFVDTDIFTQQHAVDCLELIGCHYRNNADFIEEFMKQAGLRAVEVAVEFHWNCEEFYKRMSEKEGFPKFNGSEGILINHLPARYEFDERLMHVNFEEVEEMPAMLF